MTAPVTFTRSIILKKITTCGQNLQFVASVRPISNVTSARLYVVMEVPICFCLTRHSTIHFQGTIEAVLFTAGHRCRQICSSGTREYTLRPLKVVAVPSSHSSEAAINESPSF